MIKLKQELAKRECIYLSRVKLPLIVFEALLVANISVNWCTQWRWIWHESKMTQTENLLCHYSVNKISYEERTLQQEVPKTSEINKSLIWSNCNQIKTKQDTQNVSKLIRSPCRWRLFLRIKLRRRKVSIYFKTFIAVASYKNTSFTYYQMKRLHYGFLSVLPVLTGRVLFGQGCDLCSWILHVPNHFCFCMPVWVIQLSVLVVDCFCWHCSVRLQHV